MDISRIVKPSIKLVTKILKWRYRELESIYYFKVVTKILEMEISRTGKYTISKLQQKS